jgi:hypothetical protein
MFHVSLRKTIAEHGETANGFDFGRLVLKNVPVLGKLAILEAHDFGGNPRCGTTVSCKATMGDDVVPFGNVS